MFRVLTVNVFSLMQRAWGINRHPFLVGIFREAPCFAFAPICRVCQTQNKFRHEVWPEVCRNLMHTFLLCSPRPPPPPRIVVYFFSLVDLSVPFPVGVFFWGEAPLVLKRRLIISGVQQILRPIRIPKPAASKKIGWIYMGVSSLSVPFGPSKTKNNQGNLTHLLGFASAPANRSFPVADFRKARPLGALRQPPAIHSVCESRNYSKPWFNHPLTHCQKLRQHLHP